jgi:tetratricopeptide (TPR) repeat protein
MKKILFFAFCFITVSLAAQNDEMNAAKKIYSSGVVFYQNKDYVNAIKDFSKAIQYRAKITDSYLLCDMYIARAMCRMYLGSKDALSDASEAVAIKPEYSKTYYIRALIRLHGFHDPDNALRDIDSALVVKPGEPAYMLFKMTCYSFKKMFKEELAVANQILADDPKNVEAIVQRGSVNLSLKDYDAAIRDFKSALEANPNDFATLCDLANSYAQQKNWEEAKTYFLKSIKADSSQAFIVYNNLAYYIGDIKGDYKAAVDYCNQAIAINPKFAYSFSNRGFAEFKNGDTKTALADIQKSIDMDPKNSYAYKNRALILIAQNKISSACLDLHKAKDLDYALLYDDDVDKLIEKNCH